MSSKKISLAKALMALLLPLTLAALACGRGNGANQNPTPSRPTQSSAPAQPLANAPVPAGVPVDNGAILFQDDFQDGQPDNWETSGAWYVEQQGDVYIFGAGGRGWAWVPSGNSWSNYIFHAGVRLESGTLFLSMNLTETSRYLLRLDQTGVYLIKEQPVGNMAILAQTGPITMSAGHSVVIAGQNGHVQVYVDSALWIDYTDPAPITQGTIGVSSLDGSRVGVDNVLVILPSGSLPTGVVQAPAPVAGVPLSVEDIEQEGGGMPLDDVVIDENPEPPPPEGALPDLVATGVEFSPDPVIQGQPFQVVYRLSNQGNADAGAFTARLHFHAATGLPDCNTDFPSLGAGENGMAFCNFTTNAQPGTSPTEFTVDLENEIVESNENNNFAAPTLTIAAAGDNGGGGDGGGGNGDAGLPDLVIAEFRLPEHVAQGQNFIPYILVSNQGNAAAGAFTVRLHFHPNTGLPDCNWDVAGLGAGSTTGYLDQASCNRATNAAPGGYRTDLTLDVEGEIAESNENNNTSNQPLTVTSSGGGGGGGGGGNAGQPDLVITSVVFNPNPAIQGRPFAALITISNQGNAAAGIFTVRLRFHQNTGLPDCNWDVSTLGAGGSIRLDCTLTTNAPPGGYRTDLIVDVEGEIAESNENNNTSNQPLTVAAP